MYASTGGGTRKRIERPAATEARTPAAEMSRAVPVGLDARDAEARHAGHRQLEHAQAVLRRRQALLVRRERRGHEPDLVQPLRLAHLLRGAQVPQMDRVERPAEDADAAHARIWPLPCTWYL